MRSVATIAGLVVALGGGYFVYQTQMTQRDLVDPSPQQQIDVVDIRSHLLAIGHAEQQYLVTHGTYATLEQIQQEGLSTLGAERRGYVFRVAVDGSRRFTVTATPSDANNADWPTLVIDETMQISER